MIIKFKIVIILTLLHYKCFSQNNIDNYKDIDKKELKIISENILEKYLYNYLKSLNRKLDNEYSFFPLKNKEKKNLKISILIIYIMIVMMLNWLSICL